MRPVEDQLDPRVGVVCLNIYSRVTELLGEQIPGSLIGAESLLGDEPE
jgi:hypothetical protein